MQIVYCSAICNAHDFKVWSSNFHLNFLQKPWPRHPRSVAYVVHHAARADADAWAVFWQPKPPPGFHDIMALLRQKRMRFEGRLQPMMAHLFYVKMVLEIPRGGGAAL